MFTRITLSLLVVVAAGAALGCDDGKSTVIGPTDPTSPSAAFVNRLVFAPLASVQALPVPHAVCPQSRFVAPFDLVISADSFSDVFLTRVQMQFADQTGTLTPPTMITQPNLSMESRSTRVPAGASRTFPFEFGLGCTSVPPGTLNLVVVTTDSQQHERQTPLRLPVR